MPMPLDVPSAPTFGSDEYKRVSGGYKSVFGRYNGVFEALVRYTKIEVDPEYACNGLLVECFRYV